jgi:hypothetical protein
MRCFRHAKNRFVLSCINMIRDPIDVASANALEEALIGFDDASFGRDDFIRQRATIAASSKPSLVVMPPSSTNGP